mmetsp:Transcript_20362/g.25176  ORF Transcript_20362/g.25176 Transcript_20362/m.25176 type:complete len:92 (+) Transcript_20362:70-345(+)|eukprot:CAMPEP_0172498254 /NCGR_PEP_ID=MMETSP1066-20121228/111285_1 /TAXON_ID=671091 /ORGANISM="Coscinodiscus wailesii, Strain CCMP2513" /LENGTH=91 /DNA_ID=CAMNT_0013271467 /DNA_START=68 /DNA_END=343 /DNA_ORIENTATION=-
MALSILNYIYFKIEDANIPFMIADVAVIGVLHIVEQRLKKEKKLRMEMEKTIQAKTHEVEKLEKRARDAQTRAEQKAAEHDHSTHVKKKAV